jgi:hypothetical protein
METQEAQMYMMRPNQLELFHGYAQYVYIRLLLQRYNHIKLNVHASLQFLSQSSFLVFKSLDTTCDKL